MKVGEYGVRRGQRRRQERKRTALRRGSGGLERSLGKTPQEGYETLPQEDNSLHWEPRWMTLKEMEKEGILDYKKEDHNKFLEGYEIRSQKRKRGRAFEYFVDEQLAKYLRLIDDFDEEAREKRLKLIKGRYELILEDRITVETYLHNRRIEETGNDRWNE